VTRYVVNRLVSGFVTLVLFVTLLFFFVHVVIPGDFVTSLGPMNAETAASLRAQLGLDRPLLVQYFSWVASLASLDMGSSFQQQLGAAAGGPSVWDQVREAMAPTLTVLILGLAVAFVLGSWLGRVSGFATSSLLSRALTFVGIVTLTIFPPALAVALEQGVESYVGWRGLGEFGMTDPAIWQLSSLSQIGVLWRVVAVMTATVALLWAIHIGFRRLVRRSPPRILLLLVAVLVPLGVWSQMGLGERIIDLAGTLALLTVAIVVLTFGEILLVTRAAMDDAVLEDYVLVARAKGLPERAVRDRHAARTALLPVLSRLAVAVPYFMTGLVILEIVFAGSNRSGGLAVVGAMQRVTAPPGLGTLLFGSMTSQDLPLLLGALLIVGMITLTIRIVLDVAHAALDPRIRFSSGGNDGSA